MMPSTLLKFVHVICSYFTPLPNNLQNDVTFFCTLVCLTRFFFLFFSVLRPLFPLFTLIPPPLSRLLSSVSYLTVPAKRIKRRAPWHVFFTHPASLVLLYASWVFGWIGTVLHNTSQHISVQLSTIQYNSIQYSRVQLSI